MWQSSTNFYGSLELLASHFATFTHINALRIQNATDFDY